jgi:hypothetical protein
VGRSMTDVSIAILVFILVGATVWVLLGRDT